MERHQILEMMGELKLAGMRIGHTGPVYTAEPSAEAFGLQLRG